ncbi:MAG: hypothetical protein KatS3mg081_1297 [Gemmatimonadales bacterium]|nr:hypothetical protein HRbin33_00546 [bacterium HR33]GIW51942.1 MAG: hypothetical protein KatS3mg081_1297 [Gemmatimonadales bacterium]
MGEQSAKTSAAVLERMKSDRPLVAVELRPPKAGLSQTEGMDVWIDMYHSIRRLASQDTVIFLTDNAVGEAEEENLQHLTTNLAEEVDPAKVVPFLTCKHALDYCLVYAARAASFGFQALTVLGGDRSVGPPRCVEYAYMLRQLIRERVPSLSLGGWVNPHRDPVRQVDFLLAEHFTAEFYLTQIVSHHSIRAVEAFLGEARRRGVAIPGVFGVFLYRSANPETLRRLQPFFPVPAAEITAEFESGLSAEEICARSIRALREVGVDKVYVSNLGFRKPEQRYRRLMEVLG